MAKFAFQAGQRISIENVLYDLDRMLPNRTWQMENVATREYSKRALDELLELYRRGLLTLFPNLVASDTVGEYKPGVLQPDLSSYTPKQTAYATRMEAYMQEIDACLPDSLSDQDLEQLIQRVAGRINDSKPPSTRSIRRARKPWIASGRDIHSQIPRFKDRGVRSTIPDYMKWLMRASINCTFLTPLKKKITRTHQDLISKLNAINSGDHRLIQSRFTREEQASPELEQLMQQAKETGPIAVPSLWSLYRLKNDLTDHEILTAQMGKRYADTVYRISFPGSKSPRPLERVDGDETKTDLFVIDEVRQLLLGRAYCVCLYDAYGPGVCGFYLGFEPQSQLSYFNAIRHQILPKSYVASEYPVIKNRWDIHGVAEWYNLDNAMAAHGEDFENVARQLGTTITFDPPKTPWYKGLIERFFRELNSKLMQDQIGTTFSNISHLGGDYDPTKNAVIPYRLLLMMFHKWIIDNHLQSPNRGMQNQTPAYRWASHIDEIPPLMPPNASELDMILGRRFEKPIFHYGIEHDHLTYQSRELGELRKHLARPNCKYPRVEITVPGGDLGRIYVLDPSRDEKFMVPATDPHKEYANGLSAWAHKAHIQHCKANKGRVDIHALAESQTEIWSWCLTAAKLNKTVARYMENHARPHPTGNLASMDLVIKMVDQLAGKTVDNSSQSPRLPSRVVVPKSMTDLAVDDLPEFKTSEDLPVLSYGGSDDSTY